MTPQQIDGLSQFEASAAYSEMEKDVLRFAEQWAIRSDVDPKVLERLSRNLTPSEMVILAATVGQANFTSRFNIVFGIPLP